MNSTSSTHLSVFIVTKRPSPLSSSTCGLSPEKLLFQPKHSCKEHIPWTQFFWNVYSENYYSGKMFRPMLGRLQTLSHHTYQNTIPCDVLNKAIVYFTFCDDRGPDGDKTRWNILPENNLGKTFQIRIWFRGISSLMSLCNTAGYLEQKTQLFICCNLHTYHVINKIFMW